MKKDINKLVSCPVCKVKLNSKNLNKHIDKVHNSDPFKPINQNKPVINKFKSEAEKRRYWRDKEGPEHDDSSKDIFETGKVLNGGAYGLGKNRKH